MAEEILDSLTWCREVENSTVGRPGDDVGGVGVLDEATERLVRGKRLIAVAGKHVGAPVAGIVDIEFPRTIGVEGLLKAARSSPHE